MLLGNEDNSQLDGLPLDGEPVLGAEATPAPGPAPEGDDFLEFKNRDESWKAPKALAQQLADEMGWDLDQLKEAIEIGHDGRKIYQGINQTRDELEQRRTELEGILSEMQERRVAPQDGRNGQGFDDGRSRAPMPRPAATDVTGTVFWLADQLERLSPLLSEIPEIKRGLERTHQTIEDREKAKDQAEERSHSMQAYDDMAQQWKKEWGSDPPPRIELERYLRRFPMHENVDMTWQEIWQGASWVVAGAQVARKQRRQAVLDSQQPEARITVPVRRAPGAPAGPMSRKPLTGNETQEELAANIQDLESRLSGVTLAQLRGPQ